MPSRSSFFRRLTCVFGGCVIVTAPVMAQTIVPYTGTIKSIFMSGRGNYAVRVELWQNGTGQLCTCPGYFAYINTSDSNYQAYTAGLLTRYVQGQSIMLNVDRDVNNFFHTAELSM